MYVEMEKFRYVGASRNILTAGRRCLITWL